ncbi:DsbA family protein [Streptomyces bambusae]|uniref:DsbA family protein n=1 Tax=Streptomyces bambusae TaxID=1550616 RepID=UPI001CFD67BD|nr:thioredoxin domain-containing protein [Streptomyces bambusae]MCB5166159.1 DsbA family protein [Streptomyces bambusae]
MAAAVLLGASAAACGSADGGDGGGTAATAVRTSPRAAELAKLPAEVVGTGVVVGDPAAPRTAQVLVDPHCGYCALFEKEGGEALLKAAAAGQVKIEYVLASFLDQGGSGSVKAVNALRAAAERGRFAEYQAAVFASRPKGAFTDEHLLAVADEVPGLRGPAFDGAVREGTYREWVDRVERAFEETGVQGTPAVLVDGRQIGAEDRSMFDREAFAATLKGAGIG